MTCPKPIDAGLSNRALVCRGTQIEPFARGNGVRTYPLVGRWNSSDTRLTSGVTEFPPGCGVQLHTHNVEETVLVLEGEATAHVGDDSYALVSGDSTWVPAGLAHRFVNRGAGRLRIFWVYGGREVTRTICATGETVEHLSEADRGTAQTS